MDDPGHAGWAARALADGAVVAHGFANLYAITTRPDEQTVRRVNLMKGRPATQVGSLTTAASDITDLWDLALLPTGLSRQTVLEIVDAFFALGPFGFRGPAARRLPDHLTALDGGVRTAQVIAPGHRCPSNHFLRLAMQEAGQDYLYITSANRSHHQTGADDSPAHWKAAGLLAEFGDQPDFLVLEHDNEDRARERYPHFLPMSTSVLGLHAVRRVPGDPRPHLVLERHGSLSVDVVRTLLSDLGLGLVLGPRAAVPLQPRDYLTRLCDR
jgi:tRNA A37 threonylcarbamoyladenosine synthetase subunit TsaC/SUA5/YrdC